MALDGQAGASALPATAGPRSNQWRQALLVLSRVWPWLFLTILVVGLSVLVPATSGGSVNFLTLRNSQNILVAITPVLLMGLGQTFVIIAGGIDLSVAWVMGLSSCLSALILRELHRGGMEVNLAIILGFIIALLLCMVVGLVNGVIVAKLKVPAFIVTLGTSFIARGIAFLLSGGQTVPGLPPQIRDYGNESLLYYVGGEVNQWFFLRKPDITTDQLRALDRVLSWPVIVTAIVVAIAIFVLHKTQFGRHTYAIGGSKEAASRAGVPVVRHLILLYVLSSATAAIAGVLHTARFTAGAPDAGDPLLMGSIAAVVIGGVSMFGGVGTIIGTVIGALIIAVLQTGQVMLTVEPFYQYIVVGAVVIIAVLIDQLRDLIIGRAEG